MVRVSIYNKWNCNCHSKCAATTSANSWEMKKQDRTVQVTRCFTAQEFPEMCEVAYCTAPAVLCGWLCPWGAAQTMLKLKPLLIHRCWISRELIFWFFWGMMDHTLLYPILYHLGDRKETILETCLPILPGIMIPKLKPMSTACPRRRALAPLWPTPRWGWPLGGRQFARFKLVPLTCCWWTGHRKRPETQTWRTRMEPINESWGMAISWQEDVAN